MKTIHIILISIFLTIIYTGCGLGFKPDMPKKEDYPDNVPCYLADVCLTVNAYMVNNKTDCLIALQKCYRYTDYDKCKKEPTEELQNDCRNAIVIKY